MQFKIRDDVRCLGVRGAFAVHTDLHNRLVDLTRRYCGGREEQFWIVN